MRQNFKTSIDGPTASGKTTLGKAVAERDAGAFLDTGLTYRALAYVFARRELPGGADWRSIIEHVPLRFDLADGSREPTEESVYYCGLDITNDLWSFEVEQVLQDVARNPEWRGQATEYHQEILEQYPIIVAAGRDVSTTIMRGGDFHVFLYADETVRRERRRAQYSNNPERAVTVGPITTLDIQTREYVARQATALVIDTSALSAAAVFDMVIGYIDNTLVGKIRR